MGNVSLKLSRPMFILLEALVNGAIFYLAPLIPNYAVQGFVVTAGNALIVFLVTETPKNGGTPAPAPVQA